MQLLTIKDKHRNGNIVTVRITAITSACRKKKAAHPVECAVFSAVIVRFMAGQCVQSEYPNNRSESVVYWCYR